MAPQQSNDAPDNTALAISPALIVGIVIIAAFFCTLIFASLYRFCGRRSSNGLTSEAFAARDTDTVVGINAGGAFWNPNRQRSAAQMARMKEVRWINNMYAWERGRHARLETGEIRPTTMVMGRKGENRSWDEYTVAEDSSGREGSGHASGDHAGPYFYNAENPYGRLASQQRLSHLAPSTNGVRASYLSTGNASGLLPRHPSALLPPPINEQPGTVLRRSPLRHEYQAEAAAQDASGYQEAASAPGLCMVGQEAQELPTQPRTPNPIITVNDRKQNFPRLYCPDYAEDTNFETISLRDESPSGGQGGRGSGSVDPAQPPSNFSRPREGHNVTPTQRPSVVVTDGGSLPKLQLQFTPLPQSHSHQTVSSIYDDDEAVDVNNSSPHAGNGRPGIRNHAEEEREPLKEAQSPEEEAGGSVAKDNVKDMIQEWERVNGHFGRG
ncbi:hypothetical protein A1O7_07868 [Cladophialophora yegresii CBS 114405]|uniref:Uncharacterized protein n=1 Tax=Cladophialophora yegresii CBS 114405 TaxID=1182544 RepID=W9VXT4_9EURO|nr:uncharacterized protein A1O7_07868 [Cladophialophora yegresii CBS 114405]EXJ57520.1 hypothetical protein A1O7_07868 [Cladophialophora yegresii CBS 114405]